MVVTSRMPLYVLLMSSYVGLMSVYGCGGATTTSPPDPCNGDELRQCLDVNKGADCDQVQKMMDCYKGKCDCTCKSLDNDDPEDSFSCNFAELPKSLN